VDEMKTINELKARIKRDTAKIAELEKEVKPMFGQALKIQDCRAYLLPHGGTAISSLLPNNEILIQGNYFISKKAAEHRVEVNRLKQLARIDIDASWWNERLDWSDEMQIKYVVFVSDGKIETITAALVIELLAFRTEEDAEDFKNKYTVEQIKMMLEL
jgi:hypothetical protein